MSKKALLVTAVALVVTAVVLAGCGEKSPGTPAQMMKKAIEAQSKIKSLHLEVDSDIDLSMPGATRSATVSYKGDYEEPDRWKLRVRTGDSYSDVVVIGDTVYIKLPGSDAWTQKTGQMAREATTPGNVVGTEYLKSAKDLKLVDRKDDTYHLQFDLDMNSFLHSFNLGGIDPSAFKGKKAKMDVWIKKDTMRIEKATMSFSGTFVGEASGKLVMSQELELSDFNEPVSIEPPI